MIKFPWMTPLDGVWEVSILLHDAIDLWVWPLLANHSGLYSFWQLEGVGCPVGFRVER